MRRIQDCFSFSPIKKLNVAEKPTDSDDPHSDSDDEMDIINIFLFSLRSQQPISSDAYFCYKSVILQQDIERVFVLFWLGLANLIAVFWHPQCVEENLNAIVNV